MPTAPTITHAAWSQQQIALTGTGKKFAIFARWNPVSGAQSYRVNITADTDSISTDVGALNPQIYWETDVTPVSGDTLEVETFDGTSHSTPTVITLDPIVVGGPSSIVTALRQNVFSGFALGPSRPANWAWTLAGAPAGLSITAKDVGSDGGIIVGSATEEGLFKATVGITNYTASANVLSAQNFAVDIEVTGERYVAQFHDSPARTGICIRYPKGDVASWNFSASGELELQLGESRVVHAILRDGTGFLASGVTNLQLVAKLPGQQDSPPIFSAVAATPTAGTFGSVAAWPVTVVADSVLLRSLFSAANAPEVSAPDAAGVLLQAQISYAHGGTVWRSRLFPIRILQPL